MADKSGLSLSPLGGKQTNHPFLSSLQKDLVLVPLPPQGAWGGCFCTDINTNHSSLSLPVSAVKVKDLFKWIQLLPSSCISSSEWDIPSGVQLCLQSGTHSSVGVGEQIQLPGLLQHPASPQGTGWGHSLWPWSLPTHPGTAGPHVPARMIRDKLSSFIQDLLLSAGRRLLGILVS